jgi:hypothetical protein
MTQPALSPYPVRYHDDGLPAEGIDPREYPDLDLD